MNPDADHRTDAPAARPGGLPAPCVLSALVMLGVPAAWVLAAPISTTTSSLPDGASMSSQAAEALGLMVIVVLIVGAGSAVYAIASPAQTGVAGLAVLCAALVLVFAPVEAWADGLTGIAALAFLLTLRLHAAHRAGPVEVDEWIATRRPMLVGASITTPAAIAAAIVPTAWSLPVAALVGAVAAAVCAAVLAM
ncbi:MAG TPA: hypothetical protein VIQ30_14880 [Pseudonocardia sp.]